MGFQSILIVDGSATSRMIIKRCFAIAGYHGADFAEAEDGHKAIAFLNTVSVDLIVTDLKMPKMDGRTLIIKLKLNKATRDLPVIVISSMSNDANEADLRAEGAAGIIRKPVSPNKIMETMQRVFGPEAGYARDDETDLLGGDL
jgi:two-component system, chemotaxis family, chemotaxis protein CheY